MRNDGRRINGAIALNRELQLLFNRLELRMTADRIEHRVGLEIPQARIAQAEGRLEPLQRLCTLTPLRVDLRILVGATGIFNAGTNVGAPDSPIGTLIIDYRKSPRTVP